MERKVYLKPEISVKEVIERLNILTESEENFKMHVGGDGEVQDDGLFN